MPPTTARNIRVPDDEWERAKSKAAERGETITDVVRRALRDVATGAPPDRATLDWCADFIERTSHEMYAVVLPEHAEAATWLREYVEEGP